MTRDRSGDERLPDEWRIDRLVPGGDGMARLPDGRVAFASGALPEDVIRPTKVESHKRYVRASAFDVVRPSPRRVESACPIADRCGGCDFMRLERSHELEAKRDMLRQALERTGGFRELPDPIPVLTAGPELGYRGRVRLHVGPGGEIGFFARKSHEVVDVERCAVCRPDLDHALSEIRRLSRRVLQAVLEIEVRVAEGGPPVSVRFVPKEGASLEEATSTARRTLPHDWSVTWGSDPSGAEQCYVLPGGVRLLAAPSAFTQVNAEVNRLLVDSVVRGARVRHVSRFCDAYAGAGNFALALLAAGLTGTAIERDARAVSSARRSAELAGLPADGFVTADAPRALAALEARGERFDLVLLDPPRSGAKDALSAVVALAPRHVAICSCDPVTLARDLATLAARGYRLDEVTGFDMFPRTHHVEALAWLSRSSGPA